MGSLGCGVDGSLNVAKFSEPMPWIGIYVAVASLLCGLAMGADLIHGFHHRKFWFPCKFFSLSATSLTFIAVATKLSLDLNTAMPRSQDQLVKLSSSVFICTVIGNSMPSIGIMENKELVANIVAVGILVVTVAVNICIQLATGAIYVFCKEHVFVLLLMLKMFVILSFSALTVPTTKRYLDRKYRKHYKMALKEQHGESKRPLGVQKLREDLMKFCMMAHTSSPQFVMGRSVTCIVSALLSLLCALTLALAAFQSHTMRWSSRFCRGDSEYKWSTTLVLITHAVAVILGTIGPTIRLIAAIRARCSTIGQENRIQVQSYWIQSLVEMKARPLGVRIPCQKRRKLAHNVKFLALDLCIGIQSGIVLSSKAIIFVVVYVVSRILLSCIFCARLTDFGAKSRISKKESVSGSNWGTKLDLTPFVLHLEGEEEMVKLMMKCNTIAIEHRIQMGKMKQPKHLKRLLEVTMVYEGFHGIKEFDTDQVPSLDVAEAPNCWALPLVTLSSIAATIPGIKTPLLKELLEGVNEGLFYIKGIETNLDMGGGLKNVRKAAELVWLRVDLYQKWLDVDLHELSLQDKTLQEILQELAHISIQIFNFESKKTNASVHLKRSPSRWSLKALAANSMYRICQTLLIHHESRNYQTNEGLFEAIRAMISDILCGCLTNLPRIISINCLSSAVEVREESVQSATHNLGKTRKILEIIDKKRIPDLDPDQLAQIDEWRLFYKLNCHEDVSYNPPSSSSICISIE